MLDFVKKKYYIIHYQVLLIGGEIYEDALSRIEAKNKKQALDIFLKEPYVENRDVKIVSIKKFKMLERINIYEYFYKRSHR